MLEITASVNNIKLIINRVKGCMINRDIFENALYDCFDNSLEIDSILSGYDYFAPLIKKPRFDIAVSVLAKKSNLSKDHIKIICEIWIEAKFSGNTEQYIADTVRIDEEYLKTEEDDLGREDEQSVFLGVLSEHATESMKESIPMSMRRSIYVSGSRSPISGVDLSQNSVPNSQSVVPSASLYNSGYREVSSGKLYKKITGRDTVMDNRYSTAEKIGLLFLFVASVVLSIVFTYFFIDKKLFVIRAIVLAALYVVIGLVLYVLISRNKVIGTPFRWTVILTAAIFTLIITGYKLMDIIALEVFGGYTFFKDIFFGYTFLVLFLVYINITKYEERMKCLLSSIIFGVIIVPILTAFSVFIVSFISPLASTPKNANFYIAIICMSLFLIYNFVETKFFSGNSIKNVLISTCLYFAIFTYLILISFVSFLYNANVPWYYIVLGGLLLFIGMYIIFISRRRIGALHSWIVLIASTTVSVFLLGAVYAVFSLFIKQDAMIILKIALSLVLTLIVMFGLRVAFSKYLGSVFKRKQS